MKIFKGELNPFKALCFWMLLMIVLTPVLMITSEIGASGGEQKALIMLAKMINIAIYGAAILSLGLPFFFSKWFKNNLWFSIVIIVLLCIILVGNLNN